MWVYVRPAINQPNLAWWLDKVEIGRFAGMQNVVLGSLNEADALNDQDDKTISDRANWDAACWRECQKIGVKYAGGSYSVGYPAVEQAGVGASIRKHYAPLVNAGMWFNQHSYQGDDHGTPQNVWEYFDDHDAVTPSGVHYPFRRSWWTMERFRFYCFNAGFDPRKVNFVADEWGIEGNVTLQPWTHSGGFRQNNVSDVDFERFVRTARAKMAEPTLFGDDGKFYPSPFRFVCIFCANSEATNSAWYGYDVTPRIGLKFWNYK